MVIFTVSFEMSPSELAKLSSNDLLAVSLPTVECVAVSVNV